MPELRTNVEARLELECSREQITGWLRSTFPDRPDWHVCHETIYQALYLGGRDGLRRQPTRQLRTGRPPRHRAGAGAGWYRLDGFRGGPADRGREPDPGGPGRGQHAGGW